MKQLTLTILLLVSLKGFSQNYFDIWQTQSAMKKSKDTNSIFRQKPKQFKASTSEGEIITYTRQDINIPIFTKSKKKLKKDNTVYYLSKDNFSIITVDSTINGFIQDKSLVSIHNNEVTVNAPVNFPINKEDEAILNPSMLKKDNKHRKTKLQNRMESAPLANPIFTDTSGTSMLPKTVNCKFTADYKLYQSWGNNSSALASFLTATFLGVQELYRREGIPLKLRSIYIYDTPDPWTNETYQSLELSNFATANPTIDTTMNMLLTSKSWGGLAYVNMLDGMYANSVSGIYNTINPLPTYSWTIGVIAHEWGHNIGSKHTHWCGWNLGNGKYGRIDSCYAGEAYNGVSCGTTIKYPPNGGTIMSYCHLNYQVGINFNKGFGPIVRKKLRKSIMDSRIVYDKTITPCKTSYITSSSCPDNSWKTRNYTQTGSNCTIPPTDSLIRTCSIQYIPCSTKVNVNSYSTNVTPYSSGGITYSINKAFDGDTTTNNNRFISTTSSIVTINYAGKLSCIKLYFGFYDTNLKKYTSPVTRYQIVVDGNILYSVSNNTKLSVIHNLNISSTSKIEIRLMDNTFNRVREIEIFQ